MTAYRSIFLAADWRHNRYLGWSDGWRTPDLRVLTRRAGPVARTLIISAEPDATLVIAEAGKRRALNAEVTVHDLAGLPSVARALEAMAFAELDTGRMLNRYTSVIDLQHDEAALLEAMSADTRRELRMAERAAIDFIRDAQRDSALLDLFFATMDDLTRTRGLQGVDRVETARQFADGTARLYAVRAGTDGTVFLQTYEAGDTAMYFRGATAGKAAHGSGRAIQWLAIQDMRARGLRWYDLGGLPSLDPKNGITRFKAGFGGAVIDLGPEFRWNGPVVQAAMRGRVLWRRVRGQG